RPGAARAAELDRSGDRRVRLRGGRCDRDRVVAGVPGPGRGRVDPVLGRARRRGARRRPELGLDRARRGRVPGGPCLGARRRGGAHGARAARESRGERVSALLSVRALGATVPVAGGRARAVERVDLELEAGGSLALVGESGSGKTLTSLAIPNLAGPGVAYEGSVRVAGVETLSAPRAELDRLRGRRVGFLFQDTSSSLDPLLG